MGLAELTPSGSGVWRVCVWPTCLQLPVERGASSTCSCQSGGQPHAPQLPAAPGVVGPRLARRPWPRACLPGTC